ncbi:MAG: hypothetical protein DME33_09270 [Verrucomicrobia bacterium]|nr:MAG: hypothetical protein DME33_09270 [Verrucomicrobiota bacterium]
MILREAAVAGPAPGLAPAVAADCAGDEAPAGRGFWDRLSCYLHIEKFRASRSETITNRIIIKGVKALSAVTQNTSAFCNREK